MAGGNPQIAKMPDVAERPPENRLRELREARGLSRARVAAELGVGEPTVARWELRRTHIPDGRKLELARLLDVTPSELMGWD